MVLVAAPKEATENEAEDDEQVEAGTEAEASTGAQSLPNLFVHIVDKYAGTKSYLLLILRFSSYLHICICMHMDLYGIGLLKHTRCIIQSVNFCNLMPQCLMKTLPRFKFPQLLAPISIRTN